MAKVGISPCPGDHWIWQNVAVTCCDCTNLSSCLVQMPKNRLEPDLILGDAMTIMTYNDIIHRLLSQSWTLQSRNWYGNRYCRIDPIGKSMTLQESELSWLMNIDDISWLSIMKSGTTLPSYLTPDSKTLVAFEIRNPNHPVQIHVASPNWVKPQWWKHANSKLTPNRLQTHENTWKSNQLWML